MVEVGSGSGASVVVSGTVDVVDGSSVAAVKVTPLVVQIENVAPSESVVEVN